MGSHAIDLLFYLLNSGPKYWESFEIDCFEEKGEKAFDFIGIFNSGIIGRISTQGMSNILIFEVEIVCESGRIIASNNGRKLNIQKFKYSDEYFNYKVPSEKEEINIKENSSFQGIVEDAFKCIENNYEGISTGLTALESELKSSKKSRKSSKKVKLNELGKLNNKLKKKILKDLKNIKKKNF